MSTVIVEPARIGGYRVLVNGVPLPTLHDKERAVRVGEDKARRWHAELVVRSEDGVEQRTTKYMTTEGH